ncbi:MAG: hypothetical protein O3A51_08160, partial [Verrucomicrobia bacterium]|nr:hypothetical protein [Verrucomicrobiota bacterium]
MHGANQAGKELINHGSVPVVITVTRANGNTVDITVPPGKRVSVPSDATRVERDMKRANNQAARRSSVELVGDGHRTDVSSRADAPALVLDPKRPEVLRPAAASSGNDSASAGPFVNQAGKSVVNYGDEPIEVDVTTADGRTKRMTVPPGRGVALPPETTHVERDMHSFVNQAAGNAPVRVEGDGQRVALSGRQTNGGVSLEPSRPAVARPASAPIEKYEGNDSQFTRQAGKTVVNYGSDPIEVDVTTADGQSRRMTIPPGEGVALPAGTTRVERDMNTMANQAAHNAQVRVEGDGQQVALSGQQAHRGVALDPKRPDVARPASAPVDGKPSDTASFANQRGKSVVNYGSDPIEVDVTTADGQSRRITVPPGESVALPAGTTRVERDMSTMANYAAKN